jgi:oxalate decarboxylase
MSEQQESKLEMEGLSRRTFLEVGSAGLATAALASLAANAQERTDTEKADRDHSASNPGPGNSPLLNENPSTNLPPPTDHGNIEPVWYSFDLTHKRGQEGGWTNQVTQRQLRALTDIAGVRMRLTAGSFRELHWHTANEWAFMLNGNARVSVLNPDGTVFLEMFAASEYMDFSLNNWIRHLPPEMVTSHLNLDGETISSIPAENFAVISG